MRDDGRAASLLGVVEVREEQQRLLTLVCFSDADVGNTMEADVSGLCVLCTRSANRQKKGWAGTDWCRLKLMK